MNSHCKLKAKFHYAS